MLSKVFLIFPIVLVMTASTSGGTGLLGTEGIVSTPEVTPPVPALEIDKRGLGIKYQKVRVKVFPHDRDYQPQRRDKIRNVLPISSASECRFSVGSENQPGKTNQALFTANQYVFDAAAMTVPVWVECAKPIKLERPDPLPSYEYEGGLYVRAVDGPSGPELLAVNVVSLETYLRGVVPSEVYPHWAEETLKAQTVAARSYAVFHMALARRVEHNSYFDVDDSIVFQAYTGISQIHGRTDAAIKATAGQIMTYDDQVIPAYYHADSGGFTEDAYEAFGMRVPYARASAENPSVIAASTQWEKTYTQGELTNKFRAAGIIKPTQKVVDIKIPVEFLSKSGRVKAVLVQLDRGDDVAVSIRDLAKHLSLKSYMFVVAPTLNAAQQKVFVISGRGFGHGVGLNQSGAQALASQDGWLYEQILRFYYQGIEICHVQSCGRKNTVAKN